ncbi:MAG: TatD family hydrolase, partial [Actinobacteria bacterium]|nr:TatD family hydrolase [Actinomycetota bacterium]
RAVQRAAFRDHIALAKQLGLTLQIHDRDAHAEVVEVLLADGAPERTVFHCFAGDAELAGICAEHGWYASFAGPLTFRANDGLRAAAALMPAHLLQVETDAPYLTPMPYRGRPNAPYLMGGTVRELARVREVDPAALCEQLSATSERLYGPW